jgi:crotonobetainyl-CoA:carnitine CoA-transferase CaiB-like acyl-CoA transferase
MTAPLPLDGVRVVDVTNNVAAPFAAVILADLGADVVKVESRVGGDDARRMAPVRGDSSAFFGVLNRNKKSVLADLRDDGDRAAIDGLLGDADVLVTNLRPARQQAVGLDPASIARSHPRVVHAAVSAYGADGEERDRPGYDAVLQARTGIMGVTGEPAGAPVRVGVSILDLSSGLWLALGVLAALRRREHTGLGGRVDTSLLEVGTTFLSYHLAAHQLAGTTEFRSGSEHPAFAPYGIYAAAEGSLAVGIGSDPQFARFAHAIGAPALVDDPRFASNPARVRNRSCLRVEVEACLAARTAEQWVAVLAAADIAADRVATVVDVLADAQMLANSGWLDLEIGDQQVRVPGLPIRFDGRRPPVRSSAPSLPGANR